jgi:hypothetical protein
MRSRDLVIGYAALRVAYGAALVVAPGRTARPWVGVAAGQPAAAIALRGLGVRDLALAAGAATSGDPGPWLAACAAGDAVDLTATLTADGESLPPRAKLGTAIAAGAFGVAGIALALLERR